MELLAILGFTGSVLALLLAARVVTRCDDNPPAAWALGLFLVSVSAFVVDQVAYVADLFSWAPHWYAVANPLIVAIFPSLYLYVRGVSHPTTRWRKRTLWHFAPAVAIAALEIPTYLLSAEEKTREARAQLVRPADWPIVAVFDAYGLIYLGLAWWTLRRRREQLRQAEEEGRTHAIRGLHWFVMAFFVLNVVSTIADFTRWQFTVSFALALAAVVVIFCAFWLLADHQPLLGGARATDVPPLPTAAPAVDGLPSEVASPAGHSPVLRPAESIRLQARLQKLLEDERVHLEPNLSLQELAQRAQTTRNKMSAVIREAYGRTFYQLLATKRVHEAARQLHEREAASRTIADIAFSVGFNTLSAFNAAFKAEFRQTPSQFRERGPGTVRPAAVAPPAEPGACS